MVDRHPTPEEQVLIDKVVRAANFLIAKGYKDAGSIPSVTVVDLLCEFAQLETSKADHDQQTS